MDGLFGKIILGFFLALVLIGVVCRIVLIHTSKDRYVKLIGQRIASCAVTMGILGVILFFFSYEGIQLFGARFWYAVWAICLIAWIITIARFTLKDVPAMREKNLNEYAKSKYIHGRKK